MPAMLILAVISWLLGSGKELPKGGEPFLFSAIQLQPRRRWGAWLASLAAHAFCILTVLVISQLPPGVDDDLLVQQMTDRALRIRLPDRLYMSSTASRPPIIKRATVKPRTSVRRKDLRKYVDNSVEAKSIESPSNLPESTPQNLFSMMAPLPEPQAEHRKFVLPDLPVRQTSTQTLLQPDAPKIPLRIEARLPELLLWDTEARKLKPPPDKPIQPGNVTAKLEPPKLTAPPRLEAPNPETRTAEVRVDSAPASRESILPLPAATTMPLQLLEPDLRQAGQSGSLDPSTGQPVQVLALSPNPATLTDALKSMLIPAGNQVGRLAGVAPLFDFGRSGFGAGGPGRGAGGDGNGDGGNGDGESGAGSGEASSSVADGNVFGVLTPPRLTGTPLRMLHPNNGVFDIVVMQSSSSEAFPDGADALSGRPIYTVYLQVGAPKEWILQYCVPNSRDAVQAGNIVNLKNPAPVGAPYPLVTVRPPEDWRHGGDYLLVHGFLDAGGRFRDMKVLPTRDPAVSSDALLEYLAYWEFRPAVQDGRPVLVEVLLAVPPDRVT